MPEDLTSETASHPHSEPPTLFGAMGKSAIWALDCAHIRKEVSILRRNLYVVFGDSGSFTLSEKGGAPHPINITSSASTFVTASQGHLQITNDGQQADNCLLFAFDRVALSHSLAGLRDDLDNAFATLLHSAPARKTIVRKRKLPQETTKRLLTEFREAASRRGAELWFESRVREVMALAFFETENALSKPGDSSIFEKVKSTLESTYQEPLDLEKIASEVGLSPSHLSRRFSAHENITIKGFLRSIRLQKAAELLQAGELNISEVASQVGYRSLSHFSKAFVEEKGCLPSQYNTRPE